ncbi:MAG: hypothetical protein A4E53_02937 [Pelotomaculum sp. PtaB.Bin104]|nr:MAG: hypothetical protein A4E53_02937 [Pelotomaculum sp. PtaB.Bin104]
MTTFPAMPSSVVMPRERPVVPKAEQASNNISVKLALSNMESKITETKTSSEAAASRSQRLEKGRRYFLMPGHVCQRPT